MDAKTPERVRKIIKEMVRELGSINRVVKKTGITHNTIGTWLEGRSEPETGGLGVVGPNPAAPTKFQGVTRFRSP